MASFRTHISFGIAAGVLSIIGLVSLAVTKEPSFLVVLFVMAALGSILPDMDSDSGIPFYVAFGSLTVVATTLTFFSLYRDVPSNWRVIITATLGTAVFVWVIVGHFFKRFTRHRGMAHSLPAALLAGLIVFFLASRFYFTDQEAFLLAVAMIAGFLIHLLLDEIYAAVNFHGKLFVPNKAFGSAFKLRSDNMLINLAVFGVIVFLIAGNVQRLWGLAEGFWKTIVD